MFCENQLGCLKRSKYLWSETGTMEFFFGWFWTVRAFNLRLCLHISDRLNLELSLGFQYRILHKSVTVKSLSLQPTKTKRFLQTLQTQKLYRSKVSIDGTKRILHTNPLSIRLLKLRPYWRNSIHSMHWKLNMVFIVVQFEL